MELIEYLNTNAKFDKHYYFGYPRINHSKVVDFEKYGPKSLAELPKQTKAMNFGSLVDCMLFTPEQFDNEFYICDSDNVLTEKQLELFELFQDHLYNDCCVYNLTPTEKINDFVLSVCREHKIYSSFKDNTVIQKVTSLYESFQKYEQNMHKISITADEYNKAKEVIDALKTSELSGKLFTNFKKFYQVAVINDQTKVLFDMILIDEENHTIIPVDLKVTQSSEMEWIDNSFYKFRYYRQAEMYMDSLEELINECDDNDWIVEDFKFLVVSAQNPMPMLFSFPVKYNEEDNLVISKKGASVPRYTKIIDELQWHLENREYSYPKDIIMDLYSNKHTNNLTYINIID